MSKVDEIVDKILNHYSKLNKLHELKIMLEKHNLKRVNKKEESSLIFDCNHNFNHYHVFFEFINYKINNCN